MRIVVVGGTGMIGGHAALHLQSQGHEVSIAGRNAPAKESALAQLPYLRCDYINEPADPAVFSAFDAMVFAAGNDIRHLPPETLPDDHWQRANTEAIPKFIASVRDAGIKRVVMVGSFYPQAAPEIAESDGYARSRKLSDERSRASASDHFHVSSINAPFVVGCVPGLVLPMFEAYTNYALGRIPDLPAFAPPGGVNFISTASLSEAIEGALRQAENGRAYLVGDENLSFAQFFGAFFEAAGQKAPEMLDQEHPLLPDAAILWGRGNNLFFDVPAESLALGYRRNDITRTIAKIVNQYR